VSKGSEKIVFRMTASMRREIDAEVDRLNNSRNQVEFWDVSKWLRKAVRDKLDHAQRGRKKKAIAFNKHPDVIGGKCSITGQPMDKCDCKLCRVARKVLL